MLQKSKLMQLCSLESLDLDQMDQLRHLLVEENTDINFTNANGVSPLMSFCQRNQSDTFLPGFKIFMQRDDLDVNLKNNRGLNILQILCKKNCQVSGDVIHQLIKHGVDVNAVTAEDFTALALLCRFTKSISRLEAARSLVFEGGINVHTVTKGGDNVLTLLCKNENPNPNLLEMVKLLLDKHVNINFKNALSENALHLLCSMEQVKSADQLISVARLLISNGIEVNAIDSEGFNALNILCKRSNCCDLLGLSRLLLEAGIFAHSSTNRGSNALNLLCKFSDDKDMVEMVHLLVIEKKLDINHWNKVKSNALLCLCGNKSGGGGKQVQVARFLIANGINVTGKGARYQGKSALHYLLSFKRDDEFTVDLFRVLLEADGLFDLNEKNKKGESLIELVCQFATGERLVALVHLLIESGIRVEEDGKKAIQILWGRREVIPNVLELIQFVVDTAANWIDV